MKKSLLIMVFIIFANAIYAQFDIQRAMTLPNSNFYNIQAQLKTYYDSIPDSLKSNDGGMSEFNRWEWFWSGRVDKGNLNNKSGSFDFAGQALATYYQNPICTSSIISNWSPLGPFSQPNLTTKQTMGIIISLFVDPNDNDNIFAGSNSGGLFKTTDGGATWSNPDESRLPAMGIQSIVVTPGTNNQEIYIATGLTVMGRVGCYGFGVLKSTDGGAHWAQTALSQYPTNLYSNTIINKIVMDPNNTSTLFAITIDHVYKTTDGFQTVTELPNITGSSAAHFKYIKYKPGSSTTLYVGGSNELWRTTDGGNTWIRLDLLSSFPASPAPPSGFSLNYTNYSISPIGNDLYLLANFHYTDGSSSYRIRKYNGSIWVSDAISYGLPSGQSTESFIVSPNNPNIMYMGLG